nr:reverse transcriptase domain-containing protein [Tanacetum cinerariifolium]
MNVSGFKLHHKESVTDAVNERVNDSPAEEAKTESNVWEDGSVNINPFRGGKPMYRDRRLILVIKAKSKGSTSHFTPPTRTVPRTTPKATTTTTSAAGNTIECVNNAPLCYKCSGLGHYAHDCLNMKTLAFVPDDANPIYDTYAEPDLDEPGDELVYPDRGEALLGIKCTSHFHCQVKCSHWQYKFPLPVKVVATARRLEMPLPKVCTTIEEKKKKLPVKDRWQLH